MASIPGVDVARPGVPIVSTSSLLAASTSRWIHSHTAGRRRRASRYHGRAGRHTQVPTHAGRVSAAIIRRSGHDEWVATSVEEYARIAASLAGDVEKLVQLRQSLRTDFVDAGFTDGRILARELERAYDTMT